MLALMVLGADAVIAADITCSLSGNNEYSEFREYARHSDKDVTALLSLEAIEINGAMHINGYVTDYLDDSVQVAGIRLLNGPNIEVSEKWINISEHEAVSDVSNVELSYYSKRIAINRYSGFAVLQQSIYEDIDLGYESVRRTQKVSLQGDCKATSERQF